MPTGSRPRSCASGSSSAWSSTTPASACATCGCSAARCRRYAWPSTSWPGTRPTTGRSSPSAWRWCPRGSRASRPRSPKARPRASSRRGARPSRARKQADTWGGLDPATRPFFLTLVDEYDASGLGDRAFRDRLERLATRATEAYASLGRFLVEEYAPHADEHDPVGRERYAMYAQDFNGIELDLDETYAWGWDELHRIEHAMGQVAERIVPGDRRRRGHRAPRDRPDPRDRGRRRVPALEPGAARPHRRRAQRRALRHPRARPARARR